MSLSEFQLVLCEVIASPATAREFRINSASFLDNYELTPLERRRLIDISGQQGVATSCAIYRLNRITPICLYLPMTSGLLGNNALVSQAELFWTKHGTDLQFRPEIARFGAFLRMQLSSISPLSPYLEEILNFELGVNDLQYQPHLVKLQARALSSNLDGMRPHPLVRVVRFSHDPLELLEALSRQHEPGDIKTGEFYIVIDGRYGELRLLPLNLHLARRLLEIERLGITLPRHKLDETLLAAGLIVRNRSPEHQL